MDELKLKPAVKAKWVKALRSRKYKQATGQLRTPDNAFCCLGVLCNLHALEHPEYARGQINKTRYGGNANMPPKFVEEWAGFEDTLPLVKIDGIWGSLASHNDSGVSFKKIADAIEEQL
jgi:hypothetical protein